MCIACEMSFWTMIDALPPEARERVLREQVAPLACDAPEPPLPQAAADERKSGVAKP